MSATAAKVPVEKDCKEYTNYFNQLPDEMLIKIFSELQPTDLINVAKVCGRFKIVVNYEPFWRSCALYVYRLESNEFNYIIQFPIKELKLTVRHISQSNEEITSNSLKYLDKLILYETQFKSTKYILNKCKAKHLILEELPLRPRLLNFIFDNRRLEVLLMRGVSVLGSYGLVSNSLRYSLNFCTNLKELELEDIYVTMEQLKDLLNCSPKSMERLICIHLNFVPPIEENSATHFTPTIARRFKNLKLLGVSLIDLLEEVDLVSLAQLMFLNTLRLCFRQKDILRELINVISHLRNVRTIQIMIDDDVLEESKKKFSTNLDKLRRQMKAHNNIDLEVQYMTGFKCSGRSHYESEDDE